MANKLGYLFGCCAACRAPLEPSRAKNMSYPENQSVFYMMSRFQQISGVRGTKSDFTGSCEMSHIITRARYGVGLEFARKIEADKVDEGLPGFDETYPGNSTFDARESRTFIMQSNKGRGKKSTLRMGTGEPDPEIVEVVKNVIDPETLDRMDVAKKVVEEITARVDNEYQALWGTPKPKVQHEKLNEWIRGTNFEMVFVDLDYTTACCSLCNDIWDCFARTRAMFQSFSIIPENRICTKQKNKKTLLPTSGNDGIMLANLGCMVGYYLHACLKDLLDKGVAYDKFDPGRRIVTLLLYWLPMHVNAMYKEMIGPRASQPSGVPPKAFHNYVGCLDLLISYYLFICGCADPDVKLSGFPFERFHVFYVKELSECPPPVWAHPETHERLHDFVFEKLGYEGNGNDPAREVGYVSDRLQILYHTVLKPLLGMIKSGAPVADPNLSAVAAAFFLTHGEADDLVRDRLLVAGSDLDNLKVHLENAGITAIMWQLRRALRNEPTYYGEELDRWIYARMQVEWGNMAGNSAPRISVGRAEGIYLANHAIPPSIAAPALPAPAGAVARAAPRFFRCSPWKAALKLREFSFTKIPELRSRGEDEDDSDDDDGDDERGGYSLRSLGCAMQSLRICPPPQISAREGASTARGATSGAAQSRSAASAPAAPASGTAAGAAARRREDSPATPGPASPLYADWRAPPRTPRRSRRSDRLQPP